MLGGAGEREGQTDRLRGDRGGMDREEVDGGVSEGMDGGMGWSWEDGQGD